MIPSGTVTFLFTDVEGSSRLWATDEDAMSASLQAHDAVLNELISRHLILGLLQDLAGGEVITTGRGTSRTDHAIELMGKADSTLEKEFIQWLKDRGYRLPDEAQQSIGGTNSKPDFVYRLKTVRAAIFIDGPVHDSTRQRERDAAGDAFFLSLCSGHRCQRRLAVEDGQAVANGEARHRHARIE